MPLGGMVETFDTVVIGSGIGGLCTALRLAQSMDVAIITKRVLMESNTRYAQGGIAAVLADNDDFDLHIEDTLQAGAGLCHPDVVDMVVKGGPEAIAELLEYGVPFDRSGSQLSLANEGAHSRRRVARVKDQTGLAIQEALAEHAREHPRIQIFERHMAVDLITRSRATAGAGPVGTSESDPVLGTYVLDLANNQVKVFAASATVLATGGAGKVYLYTSNPDIASGDGIAMAYRAGARIANMEFVQFHPTCLFHPQAKSFLISEATRGEGAHLLNSRGERFMTNVHPLAELAPRDIVARTIDHELKTTGDDCVYLDLSHRDSDFITDRFPFILKRCLEFGFDLRNEPIPVVPAAHYCCGGVLVDRRGQTTLPALWALGETTCTGLHGANRLASNSLLECAVYAKVVATDIVKRYHSGQLNPPAKDLPIWSSGFARPLREGVIISESWDEIRRILTNYVGIVRSNKRLDRARRRIELIRAEVHDDYWDTVLNGDLVELRNLVTVAHLIIECSLARRESRGLHFNVDYPNRDDSTWLRDTVIWRGGGGQILQSLGNL